jgi:hypothetical protein
VALVSGGLIVVFNALGISGALRAVIIVVEVACFGGLAAWWVMRRQRPLDPAVPEGERAGAVTRRALVVPGGLHLWEGVPGLDAPVRSIAGVDVRDVRARVRTAWMPGGGLAVVSFVTSRSYWDERKARELPGIGRSNRGRLWIRAGKDFHPFRIAAAIEATLRLRPSADGRSLPVPAPLTMATPAQPAVCPRCSTRVAEQPGDWWEPLPQPFACPSCGLAIPAGALVLNGWVDQPISPARRMSVALGLAIGFGFMGAMGIAMGFFLSRGAPGPSPSDVTFPLGGIMLAAAVVALLVHLGDRPKPLARPRARFQPGTQSWVVERGKLRIIHRRGTLVVVGRTRYGPIMKKAEDFDAEVDASAVGDLSFGAEMQHQEDATLHSDRLAVRVPAGGILGGFFKTAFEKQPAMVLPLPAQLDQDSLIPRIRKVLDGSMDARNA